MHEVRAATAYHDAVGVGIGLRLGDGLREPVQRQAGIDDANHAARLVLDGLAVAGHHRVTVGRRVEVHVRLRPARAARQRGHQVPVHIEVLVVVAAALDGAYRVAAHHRVGREVAALVLEVVRFEGDGAVVEVGIVQQHAAAVDKHRVGLVGVSLHQPRSHLRRHLHAVQNALHAQARLVQYLCGVTDGLLMHRLAGLPDEKAEGSIKDDGGEQHHPQAQLHGQPPTDIVNDFLHTLFPLLYGCKGTKSRAQSKETRFFFLPRRSRLCRCRMPNQLVSVLSRGRRAMRRAFSSTERTLLILNRAHGHAVVAVFGVHLGTRREEVEVAAVIRIARAKCRRPVVACSSSEARRTK